MGWAWSNNGYRTDLHFAGLLFGALLALSMQEQRYRKWLQLACEPRNWFCLLGILIGCLYVQFPLRHFLMAPVVMLLLAGTVMNPTALASRFLEWQPMRWIGKLSFSLYIWQQAFALSFFGNTGFWNATLPGLIATFVMAWLSYTFIEKPALALGRKLVQPTLS
jgi:peptidoglycan/LPS O-acetylase OafA/YrhL